MKAPWAEEKGFTLVEMMVAVLIIALLLAMAIPVLQGARQRAQDQAAKATLRDALTSMKVFYIDNEEFGISSTDAVVEAALESISPELDFEPMAAADNGIIGFVRGDQQTVLTTRSGTGTWFCVADDAGGGLTYDQGGALADVDTVAECDQASW